ncbi:hypothetical protein Nepgr_012434 [Nepenthes gracilis]|uniref:Uncharacterized protein n=1 Tax=Nepenthes gracilis TaxID=150966 RepID=A0AAD3SFZ3_NEPGR|nr:hypothetical protein Nepgr_012434 [Nepenthes gracilis]
MVLRFSVPILISDLASPTICELDLVAVWYTEVDVASVAVCLADMAGQMLSGLEAVWPYLEMLASGTFDVAVMLLFLGEVLQLLLPYNLVFGIAESLGIHLDPRFEFKPAVDFCFHFLLLESGWFCDGQHLRTGLGCFLLPVESLGWGGLQWQDAMRYAREGLVLSVVLMGVDGYGPFYVKLLGPGVFIATGMKDGCFVLVLLAEAMAGVADPVMAS